VIRNKNKQTGLVWYEFPISHIGFRHAILTRLGGISQGPYSALNLGSTVGDEPDAVKENHRLVYKNFILDEARVVSPHQVHKNNVARVEPEHGHSIIPATDALITNVPGIVLLLRFADCVPVLFYDPVHRAAGLAHAGWRGVAAGVVPECVQAMVREFGSHPPVMWAGIGPAICQKHYAVNVDVAGKINAAVPPSAGVTEEINGQWYANLPGAVSAQLRTMGIQQVNDASLCTVCHNEEWYSHRAESGTTGRFGVFVMLT
jgi:YfiH family protein